MDRVSELEPRRVRRDCETDRHSHQVLALAFRRLAGEHASQERVSGSEQMQRAEGSVTQEVVA